MKVLFATDGSLPSGDALIVLERLARRDVVEVIVLSVATGGSGVSGYLGLRKARRAAALAVKHLQAHGFETRSLVEVGDPATVIVEVARSTECGLVVVGHRAHAEIAHSLLGSVSEAVLRSASCAVLVARGARYERGPGLVLVVTRSSREEVSSIAFVTHFLDPASCVLRVTELVEGPGEIMHPHRMGSITEELSRHGFSVESVDLDEGTLAAVAEMAYLWGADAVLIAEKEGGMSLVEHPFSIVIEGKDARPVGAAIVLPELPAG